ncbi:MAG: enhanced intracellular survival protein Eis [Dehalococcoidia bacterium]
MPEVEFRPARSEEMPAVAFNAARQMGMPVGMFTGMPPEWTLCAFVDGDLASTYAAWPLTIRFNGNPVPVAGVTWVSTHPAYRRRGFIRKIIQYHFESIHEEGKQAQAALHPAKAAIYRRFGYGQITERRTYRIEPRDIVWAHPLEVPGRLREASIEDEFGTLVDVYRRYRERRNALMHRGRAMWDAGPIDEPPPGHKRTVLLYEEDGKALGYVILTTGPGPEADRWAAPMVMTVQDLFGITAEAHRAIWTALASYDNVREIRWPNAPVDDPLREMLLEPRLLNMRLRDGIMARLVSVDDALAQRSYPQESVLRFELRDNLCPWNEGRWELVTELEGGTVQRTDTAPDFVLTPDILAQLAWGRVTASECARAGLIGPADGKILERWDNALRTAYPPHEAEHTW